MADNEHLGGEAEAYAGDADQDDQEEFLAKPLHPFFNLVLPPLLTSVALVAFMFFRSEFIDGVQRVSRELGGGNVPSMYWRWMLGESWQSYSAGLACGIVAAIIQGWYLHRHRVRFIEQAVTFARAAESARARAVSHGLWWPMAGALGVAVVGSAILNWSIIFALAGAIIPMILTYPVEYGLYREAVDRLTSEDHAETDGVQEAVGSEPVADS